MIGLYSDAATIGGAERSMLHLASAYAGARRLVICTSSDAVLEEAARMAPHVATARVPPTDSFAAAVRAHRRVFRELALDLLQVTLCNPFAARPAQAAAFSARLPTVAVEQLVLPSRRRQGAVLKRMWSWPLAGHVAVGTRSADDLHTFFGIPRSSVTVVHNGVPDRVVEPHRFDRVTIGCAARLEAQKNLPSLLRALVELPGVDLALIGDGSLRGELGELAVRLGVSDRVRFVGWVDDPRALIAGLDAFVLPSRDESFPLSIVEAMLSGVPVVATDVGSVADAVVDDRTGYLVPPDDAGALAAAIRRAVEDPAQRSRLGEAGRALAVERYTDVVMAEHYDDVWTAALGRRRRTHRHPSP